MNILADCAHSYEKLFRTDYIITAGHKGKLLKVTIAFQADQFHHLIGLHKLIDLPHISKHKSKNVLFRNIKAGELTYEKISTSAYIEEVENRLKYFNRIEGLLSRDIVLKFDKNKAHTSINADILIYEHFEQEYIHLFFQAKQNKIFVPCSFFSSDNNKYVERQEIYKVINLEKVKRW